MILLAAALLAQTPAANPAPLNAEIIAYCRANMGLKLGRGECSDLADFALRKVKAAARPKDFPQKGDNVWGELVAILELKGGRVTTTQARAGVTPLPGDILQFRDAKVGRTTVYPDGSSEWYSATFAHHTAVLGPMGSDGAWTLYEQNSNERKYVVESRFVPADLQSGWVRVYRATPSPEPPLVP